MMAKHLTQSRQHQATLMLLAAVGIVGLLVVRRYGLVQGLRTVNRALGIARVVHAMRPPASRPARRRPARRIQPKVLGFTKPG